MSRECQHSKKLVKDEFEVLCRDIYTALTFHRQKFYLRGGDDWRDYSVEICSWCHETLEDLYYIDGLGERSFTIYILSKEDAAHFKLRWCGDQSSSV